MRPSKCFKQRRKANTPGLRKQSETQWHMDSAQKMDR